MRSVIVEERSWNANDSVPSGRADRRESPDPVTGALVSYQYARV
ncbi:MAG: hypothetical protein QOE07_2877 [Acidimicrobiaceae bacterium]|jgi:hypothetical protein|nr:hypothetical protein [Acidimicrobiaceae bacterium]MDQ1365520.1 hypothetical protein [Acidimicrobiaceae bacterium]MDQ1379253.1 hypothetical protein [Acidimicrobiaceae bacterium]MDQ1399174.1 hypothetical protein [Acidimicrobiaceae bacterium]MDQ1414289.1 hypothetical protein [Acidimicrobiaceae bacterium]